MSHNNADIVSFREPTRCFGEYRLCMYVRGVDDLAAVPFRIQLYERNQPQRKTAPVGEINGGVDGGIRTGPPPHGEG
jgi:hypothetical protein